nr:transposase [Hymenolepis microstoma]
MDFQEQREEDDLLERQTQKGFLHRIVTGDEKWVHCNSPKRRKSCGLPGGHIATSTTRPNEYSWLKSRALRLVGDQLGVIYYELLKPPETLTGERPQYNEKHEKVILQHDNARPHIANEKFYLTCRTLQMLLRLIFTALTSLNATQPGSPALQLVWRSEKLDSSTRGSYRKMKNFFSAGFFYCLRDGPEWYLTMGAVVVLAFFLLGFNIGETSRPKQGISIDGARLDSQCVFEPT